jgi:hypothetical protein
VRSHSPNPNVTMHRDITALKDRVNQFGVLCGKAVIISKRTQPLGRTIAMRRTTVLCMIVFAATLVMLSACAGTGVTPGDVVDNLLCRPTARIPCIKASATSRHGTGF